jgi:hypothetical protein
MTRKEIRLRSTKDRREAQRDLDEMLVEVAERQSAWTKVTHWTTIDGWMRVTRRRGRRLTGIEASSESLRR